MHPKPRSKNLQSNQNKQVNRGERKKITESTPHLRDLGGEDPNQHDGDDEAEASSVLEAGAHVRRQSGSPCSSTENYGEKGGRAI